MILKNNSELRQKDYINEKELQKYFEENVEKILNCQFIWSEFEVGDFRIDTLVYDKETNSFKIIEYKKVKNHSLIDQGYTYLKLLLERKADFVLKYNEVTNSNLGLKDFDWSQSRLIFVSPIYTPYQLNATDFKNIPIDLIKVTRYENDIVNIEFIDKKSTVKVEDVVKDVIEVKKEIIVYTEEEHIKEGSEKTKNLYLTLKEKILELDDIDIDVKKVYIAFKGRTNIVDISILKDSLKLFINVKKGNLLDILELTEDISCKGHHGNGDYQVKIYNINDIDNVMGLIRQSLEINKK